MDGKGIAKGQCFRVSCRHQATNAALPKGQPRGHHRAKYPSLGLTQLGTALRIQKQAEASTFQRFDDQNAACHGGWSSSCASPSEERAWSAGCCRDLSVRTAPAGPSEHWGCSYSLGPSTLRAGLWVGMVPERPPPRVRSDFSPLRVTMATWWRSFPLAPTARGSSPDGHRSDRCDRLRTKPDEHPDHSLRLRQRRPCDIAPRHACGEVHQRGYRHQ